MQGGCSRDLPAGAAVSLCGTGHRPCPADRRGRRFVAGGRIIQPRQSGRLRHPIRHRGPERHSARQPLRSLDEGGSSLSARCGRTRIAGAALLGRDGRAGHGDAAGTHAAECPDAGGHLRRRPADAGPPAGTGTEGATADPGTTGSQGKRDGPGHIRSISKNLTGRGASLSATGQGGVSGDEGAKCENANKDGGFSAVGHPVAAPGRNAPGRTRTCDHGIRNPVLYPTELRAQLARRQGLMSILRRRRMRERGQIGVTIWS